MRVLVTGGAGFIGSHIVDAALARGHEAFVIDDLSTGKRANLAVGVEFAELDICSPEAASFLEEVKPDVISHHAAQMNVRRSVEDPVFDAQVNIIGLLNLMEAALRVGTKRIVMASSGGTVYGDAATLPPNEDEPAAPLCPYGASKVAGEIYLAYYAKVRGLESTVLRYGNVYGPRQDPHGEAGVISIFSQFLLAEQQCRIFGDGLQTRDYVFVGDVAAANMLAIDHDNTGTFNIAAGNETNVVDLFEIVHRLVGRGAKAEHVEAVPGEVRRSVLDCGRAERVLGWKPEVGLEEGLRTTVEWFRDQAVAGTA